MSLRYEIKVDWQAILVKDRGRVTTLNACCRAGEGAENDLTFEYI